jgi:copper chaperone CopZ
MSDEENCEATVSGLHQCIYCEKSVRAALPTIPLDPCEATRSGLHWCIYCEKDVRGALPVLETKKEES